jgi:hypothetical protein
MAKIMATAAKPALANPRSKWMLEDKWGSAPSRPEDRPVTEDDIRLLSYLMWEAAGRPERHGVRFWLEAEQEFCYGK